VCLCFYAKPSIYPELLGNWKLCLQEVGYFISKLMIVAYHFKILDEDKNENRMMASFDARRNGLRGRKPRKKMKRGIICFISKFFFFTSLHKLSFLIISNGQDFFAAPFNW